MNTTENKLEYPLDETNNDVYLKLFWINNSFSLPIPLDNETILKAIKESEFIDDYVSFIKRPYYDKVYKILIDTTRAMADEQNTQVSWIVENFLKKENAEKIENILEQNFLFQRDFLFILIDFLELSIERDEKWELKLFLWIKPNDFIPEMTKLDNGEQFVSDYYEVELNLD